MHALTVQPKRRPLSTAALMRAIAARNPKLQLDSVCGPCEVAWSGEESDCWNCGLPATSTPRRGSALQRLLAATDPLTQRFFGTRKAALS